MGRVYSPNCPFQIYKCIVKGVHSENKDEKLKVKEEVSFITIWLLQYLNFDFMRIIKNYTNSRLIPDVGLVARVIANSLSQIVSRLHLDLLTLRVHLRYENFYSGLAFSIYHGLEILGKYLSLWEKCDCCCMNYA